MPIFYFKKADLKSFEKKHSKHRLKGGVRGSDNAVRKSWAVAVMGPRPGDVAQPCTLPSHCQLPVCQGNGPGKVRPADSPS